MKTTPTDFLLCTLCISLLVGLAALTTWALSTASAYHLLLDGVVFLLAYGLCTAALLALIRRFRPYPRGTFSMDAPEFTYWKLSSVLVGLAWKALSPFDLVFSTPLLHRLFGVQVGRQCALATTVRDHPLIRLDDYATLGQDSVVVGHAITHDQIVLEPIHIGKSALVGINAVVMPGVTLGEGAVLAPGAVALRGTQIGPYELWGGVPARLIKRLDEAQSSPPSEVR